MTRPSSSAAHGERAFGAEPGGDSTETRGGRCVVLLSDSITNSSFLRSSRPREDRPDLACLRDATVDDDLAVDHNPWCRHESQLDHPLDRFDLLHVEREVFLLNDVLHDAKRLFAAVAPRAEDLDLFARDVLHDVLLVSEDFTPRA